MRPVDRLDIENSYSTYKSYLKSLIESFGQFCSYCERPDKMDVEHVVPKSKEAGLEVEWTNLLLGCSRCNRDFKKDKNDRREGYLWPDTDNTFHAFTYEETGRVFANPELDNAARQAAENLKVLVKLDDGLEVQKTLNLGRRAEFRRANLIKDQFANGYIDIEGIMIMLDRVSYWSVWMTVFADVPEVKACLLDSDCFPNTATHYFKEEG
ncbi:HNH endonuclease [Endozoicomonas numazuensis]|uniref:HNH nuclease domain-containing protein n=1 Tax=Endozoicomonas numazuensis TaxID=1137799 RepID=A0A081NJA7_9GAMM|nr:HNH endonuclease [Endozoicomonas numazuensis]KEQ18530.1 hypothetical protein GZ78_13740 [Endozoicomonas numazuensis]